MGKNLLLKLISEDYEIEDNPYSNWARLGEHDSFVINKKAGTFYWNSKNIFGDAYVYLTKVRGYSHDEAKKALKDNKDYNGEFIQVIRKGEETTIYPALVDVFWENGKDNRDYWYKRLLTDKTIDRFRLGYFNGWSTLPVYDDGILKNIQLRRDEPKKATIPYWSGISPALFNTSILKYVDTVYIAEGAVDAILLTQLRLPAISKNTGAEYWNVNWFTKFADTKHIYVVYDNDDAGRNGAKIVAENLGIYRTKIFTFDGFSPKYDIVDFFRDGHSKQEFIDLINERSAYLFEYGA